MEHFHTEFGDEGSNSVVKTCSVQIDRSFHASLYNECEDHDLVQ
jgi:hypothetical protein